MCVSALLLDDALKPVSGDATAYLTSEMGILGISGSRFFISMPVNQKRLVTVCDCLFVFVFKGVLLVF